MPATESQLQGAAVDILRASAAVTALVPAASVWGGQASSEARLPLVLVEDLGSDQEWAHETAAYEIHRLRVSAYAEESTTPGAANPADAIADACVAALRWADPGIQGTVPVNLMPGRRERAKGRRLSPAGFRVWRVAVLFRATFGRDG